MYDPKSMCADDFIDHQEILDTLRRCSHRFHHREGKREKRAFSQRSLRSLSL